MDPKVNTPAATWHPIGWPITDAAWIEIAGILGDTSPTLIPGQGVLITVKGAGNIPSGANHHARTYLASDNGGEVNLQGIDFTARLRSVSTHVCGAEPGVTCGPATMANRLWAEINGNPVFYPANLDAELSQ